MKSRLQLAIIPLVILGILLLIVVSDRRPFIFANTTNLTALLVLEVVVACLFRFNTVFFPVTMASFLLPVTGLPFGWKVSRLAGFS